MGRGFKVLLIGFLVVSLGFGALYSTALGNISTASSNPAFTLAYLSNSWGATPTSLKEVACFLPQDSAQTTWNDGQMETVTREDLQIKISTGFMGWLAKRGGISELFGSLLGVQREGDFLDSKSLYALFSKFLCENPKYGEYLKQYDGLLAREHMTATTMVDVPDFDLVIGRGELVGEWNHTQTINGTQFTIICRQYRLEVNGTLQEVIKASFYNEEGVLLVDPDVYKSIVPLWIWIGWWPFGYPLYYGEDISLTIRYRNYWIDPVTNTPVLEAANFRDVLNSAFEKGRDIGVPLMGLIGIIVGTVGVLITVSAGVMLGAAITLAQLELNMAYDRAWVNDWGIRTVTHVHYIYPWTILGYLTSWVAQYLVWFDGTVREWLPNSYVTGIIFTGIGVNALILSGVQAMILAEGIKNSWIPWYTWVWAGPYKIS